MQVAIKEEAEDQEKKSQRDIAIMIKESLRYQTNKPSQVEHQEKNDEIK